MAKPRAFNKRDVEDVNKFIPLHWFKHSNPISSCPRSLFCRRLFLCWELLDLRMRCAKQLRVSHEGISVTSVGIWWDNSAGQLHSPFNLEYYEN
jgi:hypothetical protein